MTQPYSPSQTLDFLKCPYFWKLRRQWRATVHPSPFAKPDARLVGSAIHYGLRAYYLQKIGEGAPSNQTPKDVVDEWWERNAPTLKNGDALRKSAQKGLKAAIEKGVQCPPERPVFVETELHGCIVDLVTHLDGYGYRIIDTKSSMNIDGEEKRNERLYEYQTSWQLYHQAWAVRKELGVCPRDGSIQQIVLAPRLNVEVRRVITFSDEALDKWYEDAILWWEAIDDAKATDTAPRNFNGCFSKYGICEYFDHCHNGGSIEVLMKLKAERKD